MTDRALILLGDYYGSLAAARVLGREGLEIHFADPRRFTSGAFSNKVAHRWKCPPVRLDDAFLNWLVEFGRQHPGTFLYPCSDDLCWILSRHRESLEQSFRLYQPSLETIYTLLNKERLFKAAARLNIPMPRTWFPESEAELRDLAQSLTYPVLIKPRSQIGFLSKTKGQIIGEAATLIAEYPRFRDANPYVGDVTNYDPKVNWPMIQEYLPGATTETYSIAGFIDANGELSLRASQKVFQRPRRLGIGVGFEARPIKPAFADHVRRLCRDAGYFGIFEVEFVHAGQDTYLMTDFNPRYYGQMTFEISRGLPLPLLAMASAFGDHSRVKAILNDARSTQDLAVATQSRYAHSWIMRLLLTTQRFSGRMSASDYSRWSSWLNSRELPCFDALKDSSDRRPYWIDMFMTCLQYGRHPRDFVRKFFLDA